MTRPVLKVLLLIVAAVASLGSGFSNPFTTPSDSSLTIRWPSSGLAGPSWDLDNARWWSASSTWPIRRYETLGDVNVDLGTYTAADFDSIASRGEVQFNLSRLITPGGRAFMDSLLVRNPDLRIWGYLRMYHADWDAVGGPTGAGYLIRAVEKHLNWPYRSYIAKQATAGHDSLAIMYINDAETDSQAITNPTLRWWSGQEPTSYTGGWSANLELSFATVDTLKRYFADYLADYPIAGLHIDHWGRVFQTSWTSSVDFDQDGTQEIFNYQWADSLAMFEYARFQAHWVGQLKRDIPGLSVVLNGNMLAHEHDDEFYGAAALYGGSTSDGICIEKFGGNVHTSSSGKTLAELQDAIALSASFPRIYLEGRSNVTVTAGGGQTTGNYTGTSLAVARIASLIVGCPYTWREGGMTAGDANAESGLFVAGQQLGGIVTKTDATYTWYLRQYSNGWARMKFLTSNGLIDSVAFDSN